MNDQDKTDALKKPVTFEGNVRELRAWMFNWEQMVLALKEHKEIGEMEDMTKKGETIANIMLAFRHIEDARMRLGKVLQVIDDGVSVYDKLHPSPTKA